MGYCCCRLFLTQSTAVIVVRNPTVSSTVPQQMPPMMIPSVRGDPEDKLVLSCVGEAALVVELP